MRGGSANSYNELKKEYEQKKEALQAFTDELIKNHLTLGLSEVQARKRKIESLASDLRPLEKKMIKLKEEALRSGKKKR